ncbi:MAG: tripartite tricarboxylate transporter TctB family protein [Desulfobacterales bacterium]|nr:tripartite tricarboxylate transporter TctB family protein [Desulfobacterales bacterium]
MTKGTNTNLIAGLIGLALSAGFWFSLEEISRMSIIFPKAMIIIMAFISVCQIISGFISPERVRLFGEGDHLRAFVTGITLFAWVIAVSWVGFYVSSVIAFSFLVYYLALARRSVTLAQLASWVVIIAVEVGVFYLIFSRLLYVPLPKGWLI